MNTEIKYRNEEEKSNISKIIAEVDNLMFEIALYLADTTSDNYERLMTGFGKFTKDHTLRILESFEPEEAIKALKMMFIVGEMEDEIKVLEVLDICQNYDKGVYDTFMDIFIDNMSSDWEYQKTCVDDPDEEDEDEWM